MQDKEKANTAFAKTQQTGKGGHTRKNKPVRKNHLLKGRILDSKTQKGISGLQVEAWDTGHVLNKAMSRGATTMRGAFSLTIASTLLRDVFAGQPPDCFFKVYQKDILLADTESSVVWREATGSTIQIRVNPAVTEVQTLADNQAYRVEGTIKNSTGSPAAGLAVRAFDKRLRGSDFLLGECQTDPDGHYEITYPKSTFEQANKQHPDLIVRVFDEYGVEVVHSKTLYNARELEIVNLTRQVAVQRGPSEYERLTEELQPLLQGLALEDLTIEDIAFLSGKTGWPESTITILAQAAWLSAQSLNWLNDSDQLDVCALYGLFRQNLPTSVPALIAQPFGIVEKAFASAIVENIVPEKTRDMLDTLLQQLQTLQVVDAFEPLVALPPGRTPIGDLLLTVPSLEKEKRRLFFEKYIKHGGTIPEFWQAVRQDPQLCGENPQAWRDTVQEIQFTLQLAILTNNHLPLIKILKNPIEGEPVRRLRDCAAWTVDDWKKRLTTVIDGGIVGAPPDIPGATEEERMATFALAMTRMMEDAFPTTVFAYKLSADERTFPAKEALQKFLNSDIVQTEFNFRTTRIDNFFEQHASELPGDLADECTLGRELKGMQRVYRLAPRFDKYDTVRTLLEQGLDSALRISRMALNGFMSRYGDMLGGRRAAKFIHTNACQAAALSLAVYSTLSPQFNSGNMYVLPRLEQNQDFFTDLPNWQNLFGSLSSCGCKHCQSVLSPAAYLVDLVSFIKSNSSQGLPIGTQTALGTLRERRPDICALELSCENTNTMIPYIDLVNEILENAISPYLNVRQTNGTEEELIAHPEYLNVEAYNKLRKAIYPWTLPFDLWAEECRIYLAHLGVPRHEFMRIFQDRKDAHFPADHEIAAEYLGLSANEYKIIFGEPQETAQAYWGMRISGWREALCRVEKFLSQSNLSFEELKTLLKCRFINGDDHITITYDENAEEECDLASVVLQNVTDDDLDRMHRFLRLRRRVGLEMWELDKAVTTFAESLSTKFLVQLACVLELRKKFKKPIYEMLSWWSRIDTDNRDGLTIPLYDRLFQNKAVTNPLNPAFELNKARNELLIYETYLNNQDGSETAPRISTHASAIQAALTIKEAELLLLLDRYFEFDDKVRDDLNESAGRGSVSSGLWNACAEHGFSLSAAAQVRVVKQDQWEIVDQKYTLTVVTKQGKLAAQSHGLVPDVLNLENLSSLHRLVSLARAMDLSLEEFLIMKELAAIDPFRDGEATVTKDFIAIVEKLQGAGFTSAEIDYLLRHRYDEKQRIAPSEREVLHILTQLQTGLKKIWQEVTLPAGLDDQVLRTMLQTMRQTSAEAFLTQQLADLLQLPAKIVQALITHWVISKHQSPAPILFDFIVSDFVEYGESLSKDVCLQQVNAFIQLHKIALLILKLGVDFDDLPLLFQRSDEVWGKAGWMDANDLAVQFSRTTAISCPAFVQLVDLFRFKARLLPEAPILYQILDPLYRVSDQIPAGEKSASLFLSVLGDALGWDFEQMQTLASADGLNLAHPGDFREATTLVRIADCLRMLKHLGTRSDHVLRWRAFELSAVEATDIKLTVKAKYETERWLNAAKALRDPLREKQRTALVAYHMHEQGWESPNDLYAHHLIDVEMSSCMRTSRLKLAISSVQLYVQRVLMNLESWSLPPEFAQEWKRQWTWMKNYRIWEANRKVFLFPENWIEPELRDDKSPFFKDLENELLQGELTNEAAEKVFLDYLKQVGEVSRLELCGLYHEQEKDEFGRLAIDIVHVFGRTPDLPHVYYYRRMHRQCHYAGGVEWTPWERVEVDIQGEHLVPVVWNRRLYLFWPIFEEKTRLREFAADEKITIDKTNKFFELVFVALIRQGLFQLNQGLQSYKMNMEEENDENGEESRKSEARKLAFVVMHVGGLTPIKIALDNFASWYRNTESEEIKKIRELYEKIVKAIGTSDESNNCETINSCSKELIKNIVPDKIDEIGNGVVQKLIEKIEEKVQFIEEVLLTGLPRIEEQYWQVQIAWSEYKNGNWLPKNQSNNSFIIEDSAMIPVSSHRRLHEFSFGSVRAGGELRLRCYVDEWKRPKPLFDLSIAATGEDTVSVCEVMQDGEEIYWGPITYMPFYNIFTEYLQPNFSDTPFKIHNGQEIFEKTPGNFRLLLPRQREGSTGWYPFFYQDRLKSLFGIAYLTREDNQDDRLDPGDIDEWKQPIDEWWKWPENDWLDFGDIYQYLPDYFSYVNMFRDELLSNIHSPINEFTITRWQKLLQPHYSVQFERSSQFEQLFVEGEVGERLRSEFAVRGVNLSGRTMLSGTADHYILADADHRYTLDIATDGITLAQYPRANIDPFRFTPTFSSSLVSQHVLRQSSSDARMIRTSVTRGESAAFSAAQDEESFPDAFKSDSAHSDVRYRFMNFYHPFVNQFVKQLNRDGLDGLLQRPVQMMSPLLAVCESGFSELLSDLCEKVNTEDESRLLREVEWVELSAEFIEKICSLRSPLLMQEARIQAKKYKPAAWPSSWLIWDSNQTITLLHKDSKLYFYFNRFEDVYFPAEDGVLDRPLPEEIVNFDFNDAYALYNWEIFFHIPLLIADRLSKNQRFEEAQRWFHYIFDVTDFSGYQTPQRFWQTRPLFEEAVGMPLRNLLKLLSEPGEEVELKSELEKLQTAIARWRQDPFKPHLVARFRLSAYQKNVVQKYLDNLIAWADQLFRRDSIESLNEATQLYILAAEILGKRPRVVAHADRMTRKTFDDLRAKIDDFSNALVELENQIAGNAGSAPLANPQAESLNSFGQSMFLQNDQEPDSVMGDEMEERQRSLYFCIPGNDKLLSYWEIVSDRLFKIRHCMNIEGIRRELPLFEPPIDPALLVRAAAVGVDFASVLDDRSAPRSPYRFQILLQKALEMCAEVRSLSGALLSVLEKRDAEQLALLRSSQEINLLKSMQQSKERQIDEAKENLLGVRKTAKVVELRQEYYSGLLEKGLIANEKLNLEKMQSAQEYQMASQILALLANIAHLFPSVSYSQSAGPPTVSSETGGPYVGRALEAYSSLFSILSSADSYKAGRASTIGGYDRRRGEWLHQFHAADIEGEQIAKQIAAAEIRVAIAEYELQSHKQQTDNAQEEYNLMKNKFTNRELYSWMVGQISSLCFQSYQMAYDFAKRAEHAFQYELGDYNAGFVHFGYWDSMKKGLLAGEKLNHDLRRMETAFLERNKREYEIRKNISLAMLDPLALANLKAAGECFFNLPEVLFDMDYPGHYMRRIKSVSVTIPCVTGPYISINCTLTLLKNSVRLNTDLLYDDTYPRVEGDSRFLDNVSAMESIVTSSGQNDAGVFELNFRDEHYLPFEGAGAISEWYIEMPKECNHFDFSSISDIIIHLNYTAREGGERLKEEAKKEVDELIAQAPGILCAFSAKHDFPNQWYRFLQSSTDRKLSLEFQNDRFHFIANRKQARLNSAMMFIKFKENITENVDAGISFKMCREDSLQEPWTGEFMSLGSPIEGMLYGLIFKDAEVLPGAFSIEFEGELNTADMDDVLVFIGYSLQ
ncbi:hypothetical protein JW998_13290 [candidate division KSB1 bacterium]|nr:hypothetical protein [candidate division KSB1 bacterium]